MNQSAPISAPPPSLPSLTVLAEMQALYDAGKILQAYLRGVREAPLAQWQGRETMILAGRIVSNLGAPRMGRSFHLRAFRQFPDDSESACYAARSVYERWGPLRCREFCRITADLPGASDDTRADWLAFRATLASVYRDFLTAEDMIAQAQRLAPDRPWIHIEHGRVLEAQDRYDEALSAARRSMEMVPWFRSGVHAVAHCLQLFDRDHDALDLLTQASQRIESIPLLEQLANLQEHLNLHTDAEATMARIDALSPILEKKTRKGYCLMRSYLAYRQGRLPDAIAFAEQADTAIARKVAERFRSWTGGDMASARVVLDFPFVRQHHMTCAPATLSAIGRFWDRAADQLSLVDAICYDGTPNYSQRNWAQTNGWLAREFTLDWNTTIALIDRGIPFTLATTQITSAHLQAVIGYDKVRGSVICRDPFLYSDMEYTVDSLLTLNAASGPRAMVMVPLDQASRLDGIQLPDADQYDLLHSIESDLSVHDRSRAELTSNRLFQAAPGHRIALAARGALARYDRDLPRLLQVLDELLALYPKDQTTVLAKIYVLRSLERRDLIAPILQTMCDQRGSDPIFLQLSAEERKQDHGIDDQVMRLLSKVLRRKPTDAESLRAMADALWVRQKRPESADLYFLCASLKDKDEAAVKSYFRAARHLRQTDRALALLQRRVDSLTPRSGQPACTLFWALDLLDRLPEAFAALDRALAVRPHDGDLLLFAAESFGRYANLPRANELLEIARGKTRHAAWLRVAAQIAVFEGDLAKALGLWRQVLAAEPLADDANTRVAELIAQTESRQAALAHLQEIKDRFPHNTMVHQLHITWLRGEGAAAVEPAARLLVERSPGNVWARVELSLHLSKLGRADEALSHAQAALALNPSAPNAHFGVAMALAALGRFDESQAAFRRAIQISVDYSAALHELFQAAPDPEARRQVLLFIRAELIRQVIFGDGLMTYRELASTILDPAEILDHLREAQAARPDLWQVWSVLVSHLCRMNDLSEALAIARQAVDRFPLLPSARIDLSEVQRRSADRPGQIETLRHCCQLAPAWSQSARRLALALQHSGDPAAADDVLRRAIVRDPLNGENHLALAQLLWAQSQRDPAISHARQAVLLNPTLDAAWNSLRAWTDHTAAAEELIRCARDICSRRPGESIGWLILARALSGVETRPERLEACNTAIRLSPRDFRAYDCKACLLLDDGKPDLAMEACNPPEFAGKPPMELRGRLASIRFQRGDRAAAITEMRGLLDEYPAYYWGWTELVRWHSLDAKSPDYLPAAAAMVKQFPHDALALNNLACAQLAQKDRESTKATLHRTLDIAPDNLYALNTLFDAYVTDRDFPKAQSVLDLFHKHQPDGIYQSRRVMLAAAMKAPDQAAESLRQLCRTINNDEAAFARAIAAMDQSGMKNLANTVLKTNIVDNREIHSAIVGLWGQRLAAGGRPGRARKIIKLFPRESPQWQEAVCAYINALAAKRASFRLHAFLWRHRRSLRAKIRIWGTVGYGLISVGDIRGCIRWLNDWKQRNDAQPWMLLNLVTALRWHGKDDLAHDVSNFACGLPHDQASLKHVVWLALDEAVSGQAGPRMEELQRAGKAELNKKYPYLCQLIAALTPLTGPRVPDPAVLARNARAKINAATRAVKTFRGFRDIRLARRRCARRVAAYHPSFVNRIWALTKFV